MLSLVTCMVPLDIELGGLQGLCGEETDSGLEYSAEQDSKAGATSVHGDICSYPENVADQNGFAQQQGEASDWQQAYDHTYGCLYYYCERTQVRHATVSASYSLHLMTLGFQYVSIVLQRCKAQSAAVTSVLLVSDWPSLHMTLVAPRSPLTAVVPMQPGVLVCMTSCHHVSDPKKAKTPSVTCRKHSGSLQPQAFCRSLRSGWHPQLRRQPVMQQHQPT